METVPPPEIGFLARLSLKLLASHLQREFPPAVASLSTTGFIPQPQHADPTLVPLLL